MVRFLVQEALKRTPRTDPPKSLCYFSTKDLREVIELHPSHENPYIPEYNYPASRANRRWREIRRKISPHAPANLLPWAIYHDEFLVTPPHDETFKSITRHVSIASILTPQMLVDLLPRRQFRLLPKYRTGAKFLEAYLLGIAPEYLRLIDASWEEKAALSLRAYAATPLMSLLLAWVNPLHLPRSPKHAQALLFLYRGEPVPLPLLDYLPILADSPIVKAALQNPDYPRYPHPRPILRPRATFPSLKAKAEYIDKYKPLYLYFRNVKMRQGLNPRTSALPPPSFFRADIFPPSPAFLAATRDEAKRARAVWKGWAPPHSSDIVMVQSPLHTPDRGK